MRRDGAQGVPLPVGLGGAWRVSEAFSNAVRTRSEVLWQKRMRQKWGGPYKCGVPGFGNEGGDVGAGGRGGNKEKRGGAVFLEGV